MLKKFLSCLGVCGLLLSSTYAQTPSLGGAASAPASLSPNDLKIVYFGSSVPFGQGATAKYGYPSRYSALLAQRATAGQGASWVTANISVPGDNTVKVLDRWDRDLTPQAGRYVVLALALGNEGIHGGGQPKFDQFKANMQQLIAKARAQGLVPVVTNSYGRNDYTAEDYTFIRQMNLLLHSWAMPTVNLLGAVDDGAGHWATGYWDDALHPNDRGHAELFHAWVPSLFDALRAGKPLPHRQATAGVRLTPQGPALRLLPEALVHPFTQVISFKSGKAGRLMALQDSTSTGSLNITSTGLFVYKSAKTGQLTSSSRVNDKRWHQAVLTHYFARGETILYLDGNRVGSLPEQLRPRQLTLGGSQAPADGQYRNWLFYRAGMNADEVHALAADSLLKSSLELYAPLDGRRRAAPDSLANLAQSTNIVALEPGTRPTSPRPSAVPKARILGRATTQPRRPTPARR